MTEDEMVGWHHQLNGHELEQTPGYGEGQGSLLYCSSWGRKEPDMTEQRSELKEERADKTKNAGMEKPDLYYPSFPSLIL